MARINPVKLKQDADKEERAGRLEKAIDLLKQIVQTPSGLFRHWRRPNCRQQTVERVLAKIDGI